MPSVNIHSRSLNPNARQLSNLTAHAFVFEGVKCASMEGWLQSLKYPDPLEQVHICGLSGVAAKQYASRRRSRHAWQKRGLLCWQGKVFLRESQEYAWLLESAYQALHDQVEGFRTALQGTAGQTLQHSFGSTDQYKTVLTKAEFCKLLTSLREQQKARL